MTLARYVDTWADTHDCDYLDRFAMDWDLTDDLTALYGCDRGDDMDTMGYINRWEAYQPALEVGTDYSAVDSPMKLSLATKPECRETLHEELPRGYRQSARSYWMRCEQLAEEDLGEMVAKHQTQPKPVRPENHMLDQMNHYRAWCKVLLETGRLPIRSDFSKPRANYMSLVFNMKSFTELAMMFGFGDLLPEESRDPAREAALKYRGFSYLSDQRYVRKRHDEIMAELARTEVRRQAEELERNAVRCAQMTTDRLQTEVDRVVELTQEEVRQERKRIARHELSQQRKRERIAEQKRILSQQQAQMIAIRRGEQEATIARQKRATELTASIPKATPAQPPKGSATKKPGMPSPASQNPAQGVYQPKEPPRQDYPTQKDTPVQAKQMSPQYKYTVRQNNPMSSSPPHQAKRQVWSSEPATDGSAETSFGAKVKAFTRWFVNTLLDKPDR